MVEHRAQIHASYLTLVVTLASLDYSLFLFARRRFPLVRGLSAALLSFIPQSVSRLLALPPSLPHSHIYISHNISPSLFKFHLCLSFMSQYICFSIARSFPLACVFPFPIGRRQVPNYADAKRRPSLVSASAYRRPSEERRTPDQKYTIPHHVILRIYI